MNSAISGRADQQPEGKISLASFSWGPWKGGKTKETLGDRASHVGEERDWAQKDSGGILAQNTMFSEGGSMNDIGYDHAR